MANQHPEATATPADAGAGRVTLQAHGLSRRYGTVQAVQGVGFSLREGEVLGLLGPNGAGKSTTMQMLTGNLAPSEGEVVICGADLLAAPLRAKAHLGYLPEVPPLYRDMRVDAFLVFAARLHGLDRATAEAARARVATRCGLTDVGHKLVGHLSKGYQQRLGIAQAIIHEPSVVILDEPTSGLDPIQVREIRQLVAELRSRHSIILSSHMLSEVENVCDRVLVLNRGEVLFDGALAAVRAGAPVLLAGFSHAPEREQLLAIPGIVDAEVEGGQWRLHCAPDSDPAASLAEGAAREGWGLVHLSRQDRSLEDFFVQLTREDRPR